MINNIEEHLENIKIFTLYKNSIFDNIKDFWSHIENGGKPEIIERKLTFGITNIISSEKDFEKQLSKKIEKIEADRIYVEGMGGYTEIFISVIKEKIENAIDIDDVYIPPNFSFDKFFSDFIDLSNKIKKYLKTSKSIVGEYCSLADEEKPELFFSYLSKFENEAPEFVIDKIWNIEELKLYLFDDNISDFKKTIKHLNKTKYVARNGFEYRWIGNKKNLVDFCRVIQSKNIFRPDIKLIKIIRLFEFKYSFEVGDMSKPSKHGKIEIAEATFYGIFH